MTPVLILVVSLLGLVSAKYCTSPSDCSPCQQAQLADFLFLVDGTGSMRAEIEAVRNGLTSFAQDISTQNIDARFAAVSIGGNPELVFDWLPVKKVQDANAVVQKWKLIDTSEGGQEPTLEAIGMALRKRVYDSFDFGSSKRKISFRSGAKKFFIVLTDEDSDRSYYCSNAYSCQKSGSSCYGSYEATSFSYNNCWGTEVSNTAKYLLDNEVDTFMFIKDSQGKSKQQFGSIVCNTRNQNSDFTNFNDAGAKSCLSSAGYSRSLQGKVLDGGGLLRLFDVTQIDSPNFVKNFFQEAAAAVGSCERRRKRSEANDEQSARLDLPPLQGDMVDGRYFREADDGSHTVVYERVWDDESKRQASAACEIHRCVSNRCEVEYTCNSGCTGVCKIGSGCYEHRAQNPLSSCQYCDAFSSSSTTQWKTCGDDNGQTGFQCDFQRCDASSNFQCVDYTPCVPQCGCCCIGGDWARMNSAERDCTAPTDQQVSIGTRAPPESGVECGWCDPLESDIVVSRDPQGNEPTTLGDSGTKYLQWSIDQSCIDAGFNCSDGVQNQGETQIDCGGPNCAACPVDPLTLCDNLEQDILAGEKGVDCGGVCPPCAHCSNGVSDMGEEGVDCGEVCDRPCETQAPCSTTTEPGTGALCGPNCPSSCSTNTCGPLTCQNFGQCISDGNCDCSFQEFHGPECTIPDDTNCPEPCRNGAHCIAGSCDCTGTGCKGALCDDDCGADAATEACHSKCREKCGGEFMLPNGCICNGANFEQVTCLSGVTYDASESEETASADDASAASVSAMLHQQGVDGTITDGLGTGAIVGIIVGALAYCIIYLVCAALIWRALPDDNAEGQSRAREHGSGRRRSRQSSRRNAHSTRGHSAFDLNYD